MQIRYTRCNYHKYFILYPAMSNYILKNTEKLKTITC